MSWFSLPWFRRGDARPVPNTRKRHRRFRPMVEILEDRLTPAVTVNLLTSDLHAVNAATSPAADGSGDITLRSAIEFENAHPTNNDTINFSLSGTITLSLGFLNLLAPMTIDATGQTITVSGNNTVQDFEFSSTKGNVTIDNLTISNGKATGAGGNGAGSGGGLYVNGTNSNIALNGCTLSSNTASDGGAAYVNKGNLQLTDCTVSNNSVPSGGDGGGIDVNGGSLNLTDCTLSKGSAPGGGDGGNIYALSSVTPVTLLGCTFTGGTSSEGGNIYNFSTMIVTNCTVTGGTAGQGGGIYTFGTTTLTNCTVAGNSGGSGGGIYAFGTLTLWNTIVATNTGTSGPDIFGSVKTDRGHNLIGNTTGVSGLTGSGDLLNSAASPLNLGTLSSNGGPTQTMALGTGSVAIDAGDNSAITSPPFTSPATDQRGTGFPRIANGVVDVGAFEVETGSGGQTPNEIYVTNLYKLLLNRSPDTNGFNFWVGQLNNGATHASVVLGFEQSPEYLTDLVNTLYEHYLGRTSLTDPGSSSWVNQLEGGISVEQVTSGILASPEFFQDASNSNQGFVNLLYQDVLGRAPDSGGESFWLQQLANGVSRQAVALGFLTSQEYDTDLVAGVGWTPTGGQASTAVPFFEGYYLTFLQRQGDPNGVASWVGALQQGNQNGTPPGLTDQQVLAGILGSPEGFNLWS